MLSNDGTDRAPVDLSNGCPDCRSMDFNPGPRGGAAINVRCAGCGAFFWYSPPFASHRIESEDRFFDLSTKAALSTFRAGTDAWAGEAIIEGAEVMNAKRRELLKYLQDHPCWHYGFDLVKAGVGSRWTIYVGLGALVEEGYAEMRDGPEPPVPGSDLVRPQFRATGKREPGGEPVAG